MFRCCVLLNENEVQPRRPRLDPSMIGQPMDFRHTAHIGPGDVAASEKTPASKEFRMSHAVSKTVPMPLPSDDDQMRRK